MDRAAQAKAQKLEALCAFWEPQECWLAASGLGGVRREQQELRLGRPAEAR